MTSIQYLKGVGPRRAALFSRLGIHAVEDMLFHFPRKWEDRRLAAGTKNPEYIENKTTAFGRVLSTDELRTGGGLLIFSAVIESGGRAVEAVWFKRPSRRFDVLASLRKNLAPGAEIWLVGAPEDPLFNTKLRAEEYYRADNASAQAVHVNRLVPVYPLTGGLSAPLMREAAFRAVMENAGAIADFIPARLAAKRNLPARGPALRALHFPEGIRELEAARRRFIYEELFLMTLAWALKRAQTRALDKGFTYKIKRNLLTPFRERLGFEFTDSQKKAINEIFSDMAARAPMSRLLEGDVGSGKTVVALSALLLAAENGFQGAFMAPTEILAEQHFITFEKYLAGLDVRFALLTSGVKPKEKKAAVEKLASGELDIVIGTHALLEENTNFKNLRLIVIDEQHRFGVRQRAALRQKGEKADMLIMTATPIPRTLFLALYGDLDLSVLRDMPPGRKPVKTESAAEDAALEIVREETAKGRQAYIVYPVIEESGAKNLKSVKAEFERLKGVFAGARLAMLHGAMRAGEKERVMGEFAAGKTDILVATPVVEVGIDVPNATVMVINNAENFGLAGLHQLRGRVGRGPLESRCLLVPRAAGEAAAERIETICSTSSGFEISEKDIYLRGAGEVLGVRQHGDMEFKIADLARDRGILREAIEDRDELLAGDPALLRPEHSALRRRLLELYQRKWNIIDLS